MVGKWPSNGPPLFFYARVTFSYSRRSACTFSWSGAPTSTRSGSVSCSRCAKHSQFRRQRALQDFRRRSVPMMRRVGRWTWSVGNNRALPCPGRPPRKIPKEPETSPRTSISPVTSGRTLVIGKRPSLPSESASTVGPGTPRIPCYNGD